MFGESATLEMDEKYQAPKDRIFGQVTQPEKHFHPPAMSLVEYGGFGPRMRCF